MKNIRIDDARSRLIFALDGTGDLSETLGWVERLTGHVGMFKVGKECFTRFGPPVVARIQEGGSRVFLDLKFHDIPQTVAMAVQAAVDLGVAMITIHALGGRQMIREAVRSAVQKAEPPGFPPPLVLAVTLLTSLSGSDVRELCFRSSLQDIVVRLARIAQEEGASGVVASPRDITAIREACGDEFVICAPGIRGATLAGDDQKRTLTAREAASLGADYLVVGRPIRLAKDPAAAADALISDMLGPAAETG